MIKILFFIHDLGQGGAEKILVNVVNNMDKSKFSITVVALFGGGVNEQFLGPDITYKAIFKKMIPGNSKLMKLLSPAQLHKIFIKETYDIEISFLEGPSARIISGCQNKNTKIISWIHSMQLSINEFRESFRSEREAIRCYDEFDNIVCVSKDICDNFSTYVNMAKRCKVLYNTIDSDDILRKSTECATEIGGDVEVIRLITVGTLKKIKGFDRLLNIVKKFISEGYPIHLYILGTGPLKNEITRYIENENLNSSITMLGYKTNPYKYVAKCDLFVCSSYSEGFSTAVSEALIVGTPVCTVNVSGMKEMLGENNEFGIITENDEESLYDGIKKLLDTPQMLKHYKLKAYERGKLFSTQDTVQKIEAYIEDVCQNK